MLPMEYNYLTEFQAHTPDFDYLKSIEISEKINAISWLQGTGSCQMLLSANDKHAKLWKVRFRHVDRLWEVFTCQCGYSHMVDCKSEATTRRSVVLALFHNRDRTPGKLLCRGELGSVA
jgi:hypothetical protein